LLQVARKYPAFPVILETYRECLQDVFDLPSLKRLLQGLRTRQLDLVDVETPSASPYSASLLFDYVATYMYEDDTPPAERRAQALSLDRELLRELLGQEELRELLDADAVEEVEAQLRGDPRDPDELHDLLRLRGDLRIGEFDEAQAAVLEAERRALRVRITGEERLIAAEDAGRYPRCARCHAAFRPARCLSRRGEQPLRGLVLRYAKGRGPFTTAEAKERFGIDVEAVLHELEREELLVRGELRPRRDRARMV
jgi:ATP-dependent Lhr-like helicase